MTVSVENIINSVFFLMGKSMLKVTKKVVEKYGLPRRLILYQNPYDFIIYDALGREKVHWGNPGALTFLHFWDCDDVYDSLLPAFLAERVDGIKFKEDVLCYYRGNPLSIHLLTDSYQLIEIKTMKKRKCSGINMDKIWEHPGLIPVEKMNKILDNLPVMSWKFNVLPEPDIRVKYE